MDQGARGPLLSVRTSWCASAASWRWAASRSTSSRQQICGLIGPNGSGKTTLFNCISGIYRPTRGDIRVRRPARSPALPRHRMAELGIGRTFQNLALFRSLTVRDNMLVGAHHLGASGFVANALRLPHGARRGARRRRARLRGLLELLDSLEASPRRRSPTCRSAPQKRVELARALIGEPKLLLLDEPAGGLNHGEVDELAALLRAHPRRISSSASCWSSIT